MIIVIDALNKHLFQEVLTEMYRLRARVFQDRLGWDVKVRNGMEFDEFDALNPAHVVSLDEDGDVVGCMRLLQTTGPHMLADVFYDLLDGQPPLRSARIWEATRFCVDTRKLTGGKARNSISYVTSEVMTGAFEYARKAGVLDAVAVIDPVMNRVLQRSNNAPYDYLGSAKPMGKVVAMAALMDCSEQRIQGIRDFAGISGDVFATPQAALELFHSHRPVAATPVRLPVQPRQTRPVADPRAALLAYCQEQLDSAASPEEQAAAEALRLELSHLIDDVPQRRCQA